MYKKTITYTDFNGDERTDAFYFNLTESEVMELQVRYGLNISTVMSNMMEKRDASGLLKIIKDMIAASYGEKTNDGKRFLKNQEIRDGFVTTDAFSKLVLELLNSEDEFAKFMGNVIPAARREALNKVIREKAEATEEGEKPADGNIVEMKKG